MIAPRTLRVAPPLPPGPTQPLPGEVFALAFGTPLASCASSASPVTLVPAVLRLPPGASGGNPSWVLGPAFSGVDFVGQCGSGSAITAIDAVGRRAWALFSCGTLAYVVRIALGVQPGVSIPVIDAMCTIAPRTRTGTLFFDARVAADSPW